MKQISHIVKKNQQLYSSINNILIFGPKTIMNQKMLYLIAV